MLCSASPRAALVPGSIFYLSVCNTLTAADQQRAPDGDNQRQGEATLQGKGHGVNYTQLLETLRPVGDTVLHTMHFNKWFNWIHYENVMNTIQHFAAVVVTELHQKPAVARNKQ